MNERKLRIFYEVAKELNMTKVAKKMYVSQPSVSQAINELEEELKIKLFDRIAKKIYLTSEGKLFLNYVRRILNLYSEALEQIKEINNLEKGKLNIGASTTIGIYMLPEIIGNFIKKYKGIDVSIIVENTHNIVNLILENKIDFAFVEGPTYCDEIIKEKLCNDELVFITNSEHPWQNMKKVSPCNIEKEKLIMREKGSGTRDIFEKKLNKEDIKYNVSLEIGHTEAIKKAVEAGLGISCISEKCIEKEVELGKLYRTQIEGINITRDLNIIYHKDKYLSKAISNFIDFAKQRC